MEFNGQSNYFHNSGSATQRNEVNYTTPQQAQKEETITELLLKLLKAIAKKLRF